MSAAHPPFMSAAPSPSITSSTSRQRIPPGRNATTVSRWPTRTAAISVLGGMTMRLAGRRQFFAA